MHADCFFRLSQKAHTHKGQTVHACQDYARVGNGDLVYAALSDGCSGSPDTDIGARLLVHATEDMLRLYQRFEMAPFPEGAKSLDFTDVLARAKQAFKFNHLSPYAWDATLLTLAVRPDTLIQADVIGDGFVAARKRDGQIGVYKVQYLPGHNGGGAPGYLSYLPTTYPAPETSPRWEAFIQGSHNHRKVEWNGNLFDEHLVTPETLVWSVLFNPEETDFVAVFSDGLDSFVNTNTGNPIPYQEVLDQLMAVKSHKGEFVGRRCKRFFDSFCVENRWHHEDDFSMAAIWTKES